MNSKFDFGEKLAKIGEFVNENKKPLLYLGGAVVVVVIGYAVVSKVSGGVSNLFKDKSIGASKFKPIKYDKSKSTISEEVADTYANQLYNAMKSTYGTDVDPIKAIMNKLQRKEDFIAVYNAFGVKSYGGLGSPTIINYITGFDDLDLIEWLKKEVGKWNFLVQSLIKKTVENAGFAY